MLDIIGQVRSDSSTAEGHLQTAPAQALEPKFEDWAHLFFPRKTVRVELSIGVISQKCGDVRKRQVGDTRHDYATSATFFATSALKAADSGFSSGRCRRTNALASAQRFGNPCLLCSCAKDWRYVVFNAPETG